jgi:16S rRNA G966 N2-methylase RsmD
MNFNKLPPFCYLDKTKKMILFEPEAKIVMESFDEKMWKKKFPQDIVSGLKLDKLLLTNIGVYSIATPAISQNLIDFINMICSNFKFIGDVSPMNLTITETNGGLGGFSIRLAQYFNKLNIVEINPEHSRIIENNLRVYNLDSSKKDIKIYNKDYLSIMLTLESDIIVCDPPWGGYSYSKQRNIKLGMNNINIVCVINELLKRNLFKIFVLMSPRNYDIQDFLNNIKTQNIVVHKLEKHYFIAILNF